jgi:hypothetical protein
MVFAKASFRLKRIRNSFILSSDESFGLTMNPYSSANEFSVASSTLIVCSSSVLAFISGLLETVKHRA